MDFLDDLRKKCSPKKESKFLRNTILIAGSVFILFGGVTIYSNYKNMTTKGTTEIVDKPKSYNIESGLVFNGNCEDSLKYATSVMNMRQQGNSSEVLIKDSSNDINAQIKNNIVNQAWLTPIGTNQVDKEKEMQKFLDKVKSECEQ